MIFDIIISHSSYNKAFKRYNDINNKIGNCVDEGLHDVLH